MRRGGSRPGQPKMQRKGRLVWGETPFLTHPGAGSGWVAHYNAPDSWLFDGKKGGANTRIAPPPAHAAAQCAAGHPRYPDSRPKDLFPLVIGELRVCNRGARG